MLAAAGLTEIRIFKDIDFLEITEKASPAQILGILDGTGVPRGRIAGIVRSVTYRATKLN
jgi:hypothetical protein